MGRCERPSRVLCVTIDHAHSVPVFPPTHPRQPTPTDADDEHAELDRTAGEQAGGRPGATEMPNGPSHMPQSMPSRIAPPAHAGPCTCGHVAHAARRAAPTPTHPPHPALITAPEPARTTRRLLTASPAQQRCSSKCVGKDCCAGGLLLAELLTDGIGAGAEAAREAAVRSNHSLDNSYPNQNTRSAASVGKLTATEPARSRVCQPSYLGLLSFPSFLVAFFSFHSPSPHTAL